MADPKLLIINAIPNAIGPIPKDACLTQQFSYHKEDLVSKLQQDVKNFFDLDDDDIIRFVLFQPDDPLVDGKPAVHEPGDGSGKCCHNCKSLNGNPLDPKAKISSYNLNNYASVYFNLPLDYLETRCQISPDGPFVKQTPFSVQIIHSERDDVVAFQVWGHETMLAIKYKTSQALLDGPDSWSSEWFLEGGNDTSHKPLNNSDIISSLGITGYQCVFNVIPSRTEEEEEEEEGDKSMQIHVQTLAGNVTTFRVTPNTPIAAVKMMIRDRDEIPLIRQRLVFEGKQLSDDAALSDLHIVDQSVVFLVLRLC